MKKIFPIIGFALVGYFANNYASGAFGAPQAWLLPICSAIILTILVRRVIKRVLILPILLITRLVKRLF